MPKEIHGSVATMVRPRISQATSRGLHGLQWLNFFMSDMQAGVGPFLGVYLLAHGWQSGLIGTVMSFGGVAGVLMSAPAGAWVDASKHKRMLVAVAGLCTMLASALVLLSQSFWTVAISQVATAVASAAIGPAVTGITLGMVGQTIFNRQNGINQAYNHAGNAVGAILSGYLGWKFGIPAVFWLAVAFAVGAIASIVLIPQGVIDDRKARGLKGKQHTDGQASGLSILFSCKPLLILAAALALFHIGNGAMLPLFGLAVVAAKQGDPSTLVATTVIVAQVTMVIASIFAMRASSSRSLWILMLISFIALPIRGLVAANLIKVWGVFPVEILDGIGAGLQSVAVPSLVARILNGTGRINVGQGSVLTVQGIGASLSPALGGWLAQWLGYGPAFLILGCFALGSILLWTTSASVFANLGRSRR